MLFLKITMMLTNKTPTISIRLLPHTLQIHVYYCPYHLLSTATNPSTFATLTFVLLLPLFRFLASTNFDNFVIFCPFSNFPISPISPISPLSPLRHFCHFCPFRQVNLIGEPICAKGEGSSREASCERPCQRACSAQVARRAAEIRESGYLMENKDRAKVEAACVKQCFYECEMKALLSFPIPKNPFIHHFFCPVLWATNFSFAYLHEIKMCISSFARVVKVEGHVAQIADCGVPKKEL